MEQIGNFITSAADCICGYPLFLLLIGGGLFFFIFSKGVSLRCFPKALRVLADQGKAEGKGQISPLQALMSEISATVGMGNIAGVAIALSIGGPGAIFWMWISAILGMSTKFFEGSLSIMFKGKDSAGEVQGGPMYIITSGLGSEFKPMAIFFTVSALIGTQCIMQANQLVEAYTTVVTTPLGLANTPLLRLGLGLVLCSLVAAVILGGITRISRIASKIVPVMVASYFVLVVLICILNVNEIPGVFALIVSEGLSLKAGLGGLAGVAITGARRAAYINEAGIGTASLIHGASKNTNPINEGLMAMIGPAVDSGFVATLTAIPIILSGDYMSSEGVKGVYIALSSFDSLLPFAGKYLLLMIVTFFALSTTFSYSYYGMKCTSYLFGAHNAKIYNYIYLAVLAISAVMPLNVGVSIIDLGFAFMALPNMIALFYLAPRVKAEMKKQKI
jgi:amino acid carrier protein